MNRESGRRRVSHRVAVVGAGMSGILAAIRLREAGIDDVVLYEKAERLGGTWRDNTYPGIACDVPSHLYSYSFAPNPEWSHHFAPGEQIRAYFERVARERGVVPLIRFGEEVTRCEHRDGRWQLETSRGTRDVADFVLAATGVLHHPAYPRLEGLDRFAGAAFHSARFDHSVALDGRRIGILGTGSTGVQLCSALVDRAAKLSLFQRTAQWVAPIENLTYREDEKVAFREKPELMRELHDNLAQLFTAGFSDAVVDADSTQMKRIEEACEAHLQTVKDPELRARLRPDYRAACKRLVASSDFYQAIQKPNAELVTSSIVRAEPDGLRTADGRLHSLDVLVLATGFDVTAFVRPMQVVGRSGVRLDDVWAKRPIAYLSISVPGFPNFFMLNGPNGPVGNFSLIQVAELQMDYILQLVELVRSGRWREVSAERAATEAFDAARVEAAKRTVWVTGCKSWYLDDRGAPATWPWPFGRFREAMAAPELSAYELR